MQVKLIAITQPLIKTEDQSRYLTAEEHLIYTARVSAPSNQLNIETAPKLIDYCIRNGHWSVFEQSSMTFEVKTSRAIAAQILRHKSFSFQEFSQRYAEATEFEPIELRLQGKTNRQVGDEKLEDEDLYNEIAAQIQSSKNLYDKMVKRGIAKESARFILPLNTQTTLYITGNIRSFIHYLQSRCSTHAQKEHRLIAEEIKGIFLEHFPSVGKSLNWV